MSVSGKTVGPDVSLAILLQDPSAAASLASVLTIGDAAGLGGLFALLSQQVPLLFNGTTYDRMRSTVGTTGVLAVNPEGTKATYRATARGLVTVTAATDVFQISGSGTKTVRITRIKVSGTIQTAAQYVDVELLKRSTADTGGTSSAPTLVPIDSNDAAATAALLSYTGNPTLGTLVGSIGAQRYFGALTGTAALMPPAVEWNFGDRPGAHELVLRGAAQSVCINLNAPSNAGTFDIECEWTEE